MIEIRTTQIEHKTNPGTFNMLKKRLQCVWRCLTKKQFVFAYVENGTEIYTYYSGIKAEQVGDMLMQIGEDFLSTNSSVKAAQNIIDNSNKN